LASAAEGSEGESYEDQANDYRESDEPMSGVTTPGTDGGVEPSKGEDGETGSNDFMK
jgi:hypothetical protein